MRFFVDHREFVVDEEIKKNVREPRLPYILSDLLGEETEQIVSGFELLFKTKGT